MCELRKSMMVLSTDLLKKPWETSLDLVNKFLSLLLEQILTPAIYQRQQNKTLRMFHINSTQSTVFKWSGQSSTIWKQQHLPRKPFSMFYPGIVSRLPASQAAIAAETLDIIIPTLRADKELQCNKMVLGDFKNRKKTIVIFSKRLLSKINFYTCLFLIFRFLFQFINLWIHWKLRQHDIMFKHLRVPEKFFVFFRTFQLQWDNNTRWCWWRPVCTGTPLKQEWGKTLTGIKDHWEEITVLHFNPSVSEAFSWHF